MHCVFASINSSAATAAVIFAFALAAYFFNRRPKKEIKPPAIGERIIFYPSAWSYLAVVANFIIAAGIFSLVFFSNREMAWWIFDSALSLPFFCLAIFGLRFLLTAKIIFTSEYVELQKQNKTHRISLIQIQSVSIHGWVAYINYGEPKVFQIPLVFKNSRGLIWLLRQRENYSKAFSQSI
jgi:hypothetical protein